MLIRLSYLAIPALCLSCKMRNPEAGGLLADRDASSSLGLREEPVSKDGQWTVICLPDGAVGEEEQRQSSASYRFAIVGAVDATDEAQAIMISVERLENVADETSSRPLAQAELGRGAVSLTGSVFLGFASGVLTAEPSDHGKHIGVTTLQGDDEARAIAVTCRVTKGAPVTTTLSSPG